LEEASHAVRRNADPGVLDGELQLESAIPIPGRDRACAHREIDSSFRGELHRVAEEIDEDLAEAGDVARHGGRDVLINDDRELEALLHGRALDEIDGRFDPLAEVERLPLELEAAGF